MNKADTDPKSSYSSEVQQPDADHHQLEVESSLKTETRKQEQITCHKPRSADVKENVLVPSTKSNLRPILPKSSYAIVAKLQNFVANSFPPVSTLLTTPPEALPIVVDKTMPAKSMKIIQPQIHCIPAPFNLCQQPGKNTGGSPESVGQPKGLSPMAVARPALITIVPDLGAKGSSMQPAIDTSLQKGACQVSNALKDNIPLTATVELVPVDNSKGVDPISHSMNVPQANMMKSSGAGEKPIALPLGGQTSSGDYNMEKQHVKNPNENQDFSVATSTQDTTVPITPNSNVISRDDTSSDAAIKCLTTTSIITPLAHSVQGIEKESQGELIEKAKSYRFASSNSQTPLYVSQDIVLSGGIAQQNRRRIIHNQVEKRRKEKINGWIGRIGELLFRYCPEKQSKNVILEKTYEFIQEIQEDNKLKSRSCSCGGQANDKNNLPELVAKIAELENLVKVLLQTVTKHRVPVPHSVKQTGGQFIKHLDLVYENSQSDAIGGCTSSIISLGISADKRSVPEIANSAGKLITECATSSGPLPFISSVMYSHPTPISCDSETTPEARKDVGEQFTSYFIPSKSQAPTVNIMSTPVCVTSTHTAVLQQSSHSIPYQAKTYESLDSQNVVVNFVSDQSEVTNPSSQTESNMVPFTVTQSLPITINGAVAQDTHGTAATVSSLITSRSSFSNASCHSNVPPRGICSDNVSAVDTNTANCITSENDIPTKLNNAESQSEIARQKSKKTIPPRETANIDTVLSKTSQSTNDVNRKLNLNPHSVSNLMNIANSAIAVASSKLYHSTSSGSPVFAQVKITTQPGTSSVAQSFVVTSSANNGNMKLNNNGLTSVKRERSRGVERPRRPCVEKARSSGTIALSDVSPVTTVSSPHSELGSQKSEVLNPIFAPVVSVSSASSQHNFLSANLNLSNSTAYSKVATVELAKSNSRSSGSIDINASDKQREPVYGMSKGTPLCHTGVSPLLVSPIHTSLYNHQVLQCSVSGHPSPTYPVTPARTTGLPITVYKSLSFHNTSDRSISSLKYGDVSRNQTVPGISTVVSQTPLRKDGSSQQLYSVSRLLADSTLPPTSHTPSASNVEPRPSSYSNNKTHASQAINIVPTAVPLVSPTVTISKQINTSTIGNQFSTLGSIQPLKQQIQPVSTTASRSKVTSETTSSNFVTAPSNLVKHQDSHKPDVLQGRPDTSSQKSAIQSSTATVAPDNAKSKKPLKRKSKETSYTLHSNGILMTSFHLPQKKTKGNIAISPKNNNNQREKYSGSATAEKPVFQPFPCPPSNEPNMEIVTKPNRLESPTKLTNDKTQKVASSVQESETKASTSSSTASLASVCSSQGQSYLNLDNGMITGTTRGSKTSSGTDSIKSKKLRKGNVKSSDGRCGNKVSCSAMTPPNVKSTATNANSSKVKPQHTIGSSSKLSHPSNQRQLSASYPKPQKIMSLAGQGQRKSDRASFHINSQSFSTEAILRQSNPGNSDVSFQPCNPSHVQVVNVNGNNVTPARNDITGNQLQGVIGQDNGFPTILNIFAPVSLNNMMNFNNSSISNTTEVALSSSLPTVQSTYSNFSAESLIGALDSQQLPAPMQTHQNMNENNHNMLMQSGNQHLFTDFSTDTLLNASDTNLSYGIDNIMSRHENAANVSCVSPNWLQNGGFVTENSPIKSIMSILESNSHISSGLTNPLNQAGNMSQLGTYLQTNLPIHGTQGSIPLGHMKTFGETLPGRNEDIPISTPMWCWGANSVTGQPVSNGYNLTTRDKGRVGSGVVASQANKPGPSYGNYLLVNSVT